ncbi:acyl-CoA dehydrogenase family protein [Curtobacterium sp. BH-2-1-1]|uniref:acyl-CoA dehydrogenase family protein n=1 Tax=Curtobacterium sp. BH-2-1-1 TaxID=1905847 RepID=UPI0016428E91|nr:acyl-CoA dehydrogenase family protein [Curtobacterium sp. BH-2-1-1]
MLLEAEPANAHRFVNLEGVQVMSTAGIPPSARSAEQSDVVHKLDLRRAVDRTIVMEELARGDVGVFLSAPGPSMAGLLVDMLGSTRQKEDFFAPFLDRPTWSCFALTEPERGSDAGSLSTAITADDSGRLSVNGRKRYIGNGTRATTGVVFGRRGKSPLSIGAYVIDPTAFGFKAEALATMGLRAAQISDISFEDVALQPEAELGAHLPRGQRGIRASLQVFNQLRPGVAALALGVSWNAFDTVIEALAGLQVPKLRDRLRRIETELLSSRELVLRAARAADETGDGVLASAAKRSLCRQAERVTLDLCSLLGPRARVDNPALDKAVRDARGIEFMEGTSNMQVLNVGQSVVTSVRKLRRSTDC